MAAVSVAVGAGEVVVVGVMALVEITEEGEVNQILMVSMHTKYVVFF